MKKIFIIVSIMFTMIFANATRVITVEKYGGVRHWYTFWRVSYSDVNWVSGMGLLTCENPGEEACRPGANVNSPFNTDNNQFDSDMISKNLNEFLDNVESIMLAENSPQVGSLSKKYLLYDILGEKHIVVFNVNWTDSDWNTGDAKMKLELSVLPL